jgi:histidinol-phosphatase (PHP family)
MRANYHTHSLFCDGKASAAAMARAARDAGYAVLGFSSHAPFPHGGDWVMKEESLSAYAAEIRRLGGAWAEGGEEAAASAPMEILLGLEVDWFPGERSPADGAFDSIAPDYLIGSVHFVEPVAGELFTVDCSTEHFAAALSALRAAGGKPEDLWRDYYRRQAAMIDSGGFDILGHLDLVKKNNFASPFVDLGSVAYLDAAFEAVSHLAGRDIVVEVNLGGMARAICPAP